MFNPVLHHASIRLVGLLILLLMVGAVPALVASEEVQWSESIEDTMKKAEKTGKPVMMDFYTDW